MNSDRDARWERFWQWYGTRFVWKTIGNGYCPYCEGEMVATSMFLIHLAAGLLLGYGVHTFGGSIYLAAMPAVALGFVGAMATSGFLAHLYGWQESSRRMVEELAEEYDAELVELPGDGK